MIATTSPSLFICDHAGKVIYCKSKETWLKLGENEYIMNKVDTKSYKYN